MTVDNFLLAFMLFTDKFRVLMNCPNNNAKTFVSGASLFSNLITYSEFKQSFLSFNIKSKSPLRD